MPRSPATSPAASPATPDVEAQLRTLLDALRDAAKAEVVGHGRYLVAKRRREAEQAIMRLVVARTTPGLKATIARQQDTLARRATTIRQQRAELRRLAAELAEHQSQRDAAERRISTLKDEVLAQERALRKVETARTAPAREAKRGYAEGHELGRRDAVTQGLERLSFGLCPVLGCTFQCAELDQLATTPVLKAHMELHRAERTVAAAPDTSPRAPRRKAATRSGTARPTTGSRTSAKAAPKRKRSTTRG